MNPLKIIAFAALVLLSACGASAQKTDLSASRVLNGMRISADGITFYSMGDVMEGVKGECPHAAVQWTGSTYRSTETGSRYAAETISGVNMASDVRLFLPADHPNYLRLSGEMLLYTANGLNRWTSIGVWYKPTNTDCLVEITAASFATH